MQELVFVCKDMFLATLGYTKSSSVVYSILNSTPPESTVATTDQRGKAPCSASVDENVLEDHIKKYNPHVSHYRREHAPNRLYLPHTLTALEMHADFIIDHPDVKCGYHRYLQQIHKMKISFAKLGEEECEVCINYKESNHTSCTDDCIGCKDYARHKELVLQARTSYKEDGNVVDGTKVRSVDLRKVIMLPRMPGVKAAVFTKHIIAFNQTFCPIGEYIKRDPCVCVLCGTRVLLVAKPKRSPRLFAWH